MARRLDPGSPTGIYVTVGLGCAVLALLGFLSIAEDVVESATLAVDRFVWAGVVALRTPALTRVFWVATLLGDTRVMFVSTTLVALLLLAWRRWRAAAVVVVLVIVGAWMSDALKTLFDRPRPPLGLALVARPASMSFPSGHAMGSLMLFGTLALVLLFAEGRGPWHVAGALGCVFVALTVGVSRVYLGVHYASDVIASWLLGATLIAPVVAALVAWERFSPPRDRSRPPGRWLRLAHGALVVLAPIAIFAALVLEARIDPLVR
jgi:undecaprenyl-diphosphatase